MGIDLAGTETNAIELNESVVRYAEIFQRARDAGLGTTIHTGETKNTSGEGVTAVVRRLKPDRIGHGIRAAYSEEAIGALVESQTVLEICPTSNLHTRAVSSLDEFEVILQNFQSAGVPFTINTDGTYLCGTNLRQEFGLLMDRGFLTETAAEVCRQRAFEASFLP